MKPLAAVPLVLLVLLVLLAAPAALASTWTIDPVHSSVGFRIRHMRFRQIFCRISLKLF